MMQLVKPRIVMINGWWQLKLVHGWMNVSEANKAREFCSWMNAERQRRMLPMTFKGGWYP